MPHRLMHESRHGFPISDRSVKVEKREVHRTRLLCAANGRKDTRGGFRGAAVQQVVELHTQMNIDDTIQPIAPTNTPTPTIVQINGQYSSRHPNGALSRQVST